MPQHDFEKSEAWEEKLENYRNSGLTQMQWCQKNDSNQVGSILESTLKM